MENLVTLTLLDSKTVKIKASAIDAFHIFEGTHTMIFLRGGQNIAVKEGGSLVESRIKDALK